MGGEALAAIEGHVRGNRREAAHLGLLIAHPHFYYRLIEGGQRVRERLSGLVYGDQGLLIRRDHFHRAGPYPDVPIMEDVMLNRGLRGEGGLVRLPASISTSARRYEEEGKVRGWLRNVRLMSRFLGGAEPRELAVKYPPRRVGGGAWVGGSGGDTGRATLLVFAKAPRPGEVKTRLARTLGPEGAPAYERAAELYRRMGRNIVDVVTDAPATMTVCYDPVDAESEIRDWLGPAPRRYRYQGDGDLGERMSRMFDRAFEDSHRVVVIGTDTPAVDAGTVVRAVAALDTADVVLGPSRDGGYYLMALRAAAAGAVCRDRVEYGIRAGRIGDPCAGVGAAGHLPRGGSRCGYRGGSRAGGDGIRGRPAHQRLAGMMNRQISPRPPDRGRNRNDPPVSSLTLSSTSGWYHSTLNVALLFPPTMPMRLDEPVRVVYRRLVEVVVLYLDNDLLAVPVVTGTAGCHAPGGREERQEREPLANSFSGSGEHDGLL